jgi:hypothetical protein
MKDELNRIVKHFGGWRRLEIETHGKEQKSIKRKVYRMIDELNKYLEKLGLELTIKEKKK